LKYESESENDKVGHKNANLNDKIQKTMRFGLGYFRSIFILSVRGALGSKSSTYRQAIKRAT
jgi:hypothetical protein